MTVSSFTNVVSKMSDTVISKRKEAKKTQAKLAKATGINRGMISRLESCDYIPSIEQLQSIAEVLHQRCIPASMM